MVMKGFEEGISSGLKQYAQKAKSGHQGIWKRYTTGMKPISYIFEIEGVTFNLSLAN